VDYVGNPSIVVGPSDFVYFAVACRGVVGALPNIPTYGVVVGCVNSSGGLEWAIRDSRLVSGSNDTQPSLVIGLSGELYLAFVTPGAVLGRSNATDVPSLCGGCGATAGRDDIVLARIDGATAGTPSVAWVVQDAYLNSCNNENRVRLHYDGAGERLFIAYQCSGATLCNVAVGTSNIVVVCFNVAGYLTWSYQGDLLNGTGANDLPCVATDSLGGVYIAYTITAPVQGGALQGTKDVEVIRLHTEGTPLRVERDWILSGLTTINSAGVNDFPYIVCDTVRNQVYLGFSATQAVPGGVKTATGSDLVLVSITSSGAVSWILQTADLNEITYRYASIDTLSLALDRNGALFVAGHAVNESTGNSQVVMYRINPGAEVSDWYYRTSLSQVYRAYIPASSFAPPFTLLTATTTFSAPAITIYGGHLYVAFVDYGTATFYIGGLQQVPNYLDYTAQQYIRRFTSICSTVRTV
jgi:hypothetical protein